MNIICTMNAGFIPQDVWVQDMNIGGGRIIGEACHYIDLMIYLTGSRVKSVVMNSIGLNPTENTDNAAILLKFENGSQGVLNYFANGSKAYSKERFEVFYQSKTLIMDNFKSLYGYGFKRFSKIKGKQNKGHKNQFELLLDSLSKGGTPIIPFDEIYNSTKASICAVESLKTGNWVSI
jgi:predicted dehydrogenase